MFSIAQAEENGINNYIVFDEDGPVYANNITLITGSIIFHEYPIQFSWSIGTLSTIHDSGDIIFDELGFENSNNLIIENWELELNATSYSPCTCYLTLEIDSETSISIQKIVFFSGASGAIGPGIIIESPTSDALYSSEIILSGSTWSYGGLSSNLIWSLDNVDSLANACQLDIQDLSSDSSTYSLTSQLDISNYFENKINIDNFYDGYYSFYTWSYEGDFTLEIKSELRCIPIKIDNIIPIAEFSTPDELLILEGLPEIIFDGSISIDPFWGRTGLNFVWTLGEVMPNLDDDGNYIEIREIKSGSEEKTFLMETQTAGNFSLSLTVTDICGLSNTSTIEFSIINLIPITKLSINGDTVSNGDVIILSESQELQLDGSGSSDTTNDMNSLNCIWKVNNVPFYEGCQRTFVWPDSIDENEFILTLEVSDDNEHISEISVKITNPSSKNSAYLLLTLLFSSITFVSYAFYRRYNVLEDDIPKW
tara:strand:+ start:332 stop:1774 length:1443 start_codon:yes stop_codon:yes gene_type:complete